MCIRHNEYYTWGLKCHIKIANHNSTDRQKTNLKSPHPILLLVVLVNIRFIYYQNRTFLNWLDIKCFQGLTMASILLQYAKRRGERYYMSIKSDILQIAQSARQASLKLANLSSGVKNKALLSMADELLKNADAIKKANNKDVAAAKDKELSKAMIDRLTVTDKVLKTMSDGIKEVAALPDPVGEISKMWKRPNGLVVGKMRIPLGVIGIIYEARPNVTADAAALCLKSGNAVILRGGSE